jgi:hypothetical protein
VIGAIKAALTAFGALFGWLDRKQLIDAGRKEIQGEQATKALDTVVRVNAPIAEPDRVSVRDKYRRP